MKYYRDNWAYAGGVLFVVISFIFGLSRDYISQMQAIMITFFMSLIIHEFEEYAFPGGFPVAWNTYVLGETEVGDRFPLNTKSAFVVNICCAYPIYLLGIIFYKTHYLTIFITYFTMAQSFMHGIVINKKWVHFIILDLLLHFS
ncbi:hypothetical protein KBI51_03050 [Aerococcaceae bacterium zg-ZUI334]|uniref:hypothetical protein n=1 Tax=Aerococcaceae bacterium zg-252 TaxID=2796928 RepID=UPI001B9C6D2B|nr:hypothetical protein [Aerococcaceae bacterium zg-ZUI334]